VTLSAPRRGTAREVARAHRAEPRLRPLQLAGQQAGDDGSGRRRGEPRAASLTRGDAGPPRPGLPHLVSFHYVIRCGWAAASPRVLRRHLSYSEMVSSTNVALVPPSIANVLGARLLDQPVLGVDVRDHRALPSVAATSLTILNARSRSNAAKSAGRNTGRRFASSCCRSVASRAGETSTEVFPGTASFARTSERSR